MFGGLEPRSPTTCHLGWVSKCPPIDWFSGRCPVKATPLCGIPGRRGIRWVEDVALPSAGHGLADRTLGMRTRACAKFRLVALQVGNALVHQEVVK